MDANEHKLLLERITRLKARSTKEAQGTAKKNQRAGSRESPSGSLERPSQTAFSLRFQEAKKVHQIQVENFNQEQDAFFVKHILVPYLSEVYNGLINRQNRDYLTCMRTKQYLNMPELIGDRIVKQINANGDERIDHDEWIPFFLKVLIGSLEQKMLIAFKCFDVDGDECITEEEVKIVLKNIPIINEGRYGDSHSTNIDGQANSNNLSRVEKMNMKRYDHDQINKLVEIIFKSH